MEDRDTILHPKVKRSHSDHPRSGKQECPQLLVMQIGTSVEYKGRPIYGNRLEMKFSTILLEGTQVRGLVYRGSLETRCTPLTATPECSRYVL